MVHHRTCSLCDALCRLRIDMEDGQISRIAGEPTDPFSRGHVCPKAVALKDLYEDPDRLRAPLRRTPTGWEEIGWDEALDEASDRLAAIRRAHGPDAVGLYVGNPNVHHVGNLLGLALLTEAMPTRARFSAQSVDNLPHEFAGLHMFGHPLLFGVPDVDRADHLLILGANPWVSNGGGMSSGDVRRRVRAVQERGGRVVVVDPRRTETAAAADAWHAIRPGSDALLLLAMLHVLFAEGRVDGGAWRAWSTGLPELEALAARFPPARVAETVGLAPEVITELARELAAAPRAAIYGRLGVCTQTFGGLAAWLVVVLHAVTGNLDRAGGLLFSRPAIDTPGLTAWSKGFLSWQPGATRGRGLPAFAGELPLAALAEEIETPGPGQLRALVCAAGNPVLSAPSGPRLEAALGRLDFRLSISMYLDETARLADLVLPACSPLERPHYPMGLSSITVRTVASWSEPLFTPEGARDDWEIFSALAQRLARREGRWGMLAATWGARALGVRGLVDLLLRVGPYGRWRGGGLDLATLRASPVTLDLGPLEPSFPRRLRTPDRKAHLAPAVMLQDVARLEAALAEGSLVAPLVLIGRRDLRSNNSWMHNSARLVRGAPRCTLQMHPADAASRGLVDGALVELRAAAGAVVAPLELTSGLRPGVVSLPHGWGHGRPGTRQAVADAHPGVSVNDITDDQRVDLLTGTAAFSGTEVWVRAIAEPGGGPEVGVARELGGP